MAIDEVFEAKIASAGARRSRSAHNRDFTARSSKTASTTRSTASAAARSAVGVIRPRIASRSSDVMRPFATDRSRLPAIRSRPASARASSGS